MAIKKRGRFFSINSLLENAKDGEGERILKGLEHMENMEIVQSVLEQFFSFQGINYDLARNGCEDELFKISLA